MTSLISSLGYLRVESADPGAWREFGTKILGMTEGRGPDPAAVYLRMDDFPARLVIVPGEQDRLVASGWEVADEQTLTEVAHILAAADVPVKAADAAELADRRVGALLHVEDPSGNSLEIFRAWATSCCRWPATRKRCPSTPGSSASGCGTRCGCRASSSAGPAGRYGCGSSAAARGITRSRSRR
jgi:hypothetical protein